MPQELPARFIRPAHVDLELVAVAYRDRRFPVHIHDQYVVGAVESGAECLDVGGTRHVVRRGDIITLDPGVAHSNRSLGSEVLRYRVFYLPVDVVASYTGHRAVGFGSPSRADPAGSERLLALHRWFALGTGDRLEQESALAQIVDIAFAAAQRPPEETRIPEAVERARQFIDRHYPESFGLDELAGAAGISKYHLVRSFTRAHGISPLAYRTQRRIDEARRLLLADAPLAEIASDLGFADQSHLTRQFQSFVGISPARYREQ